MSLAEIKVPDIGDFKDVDVIEMMVKAGDRIERDQSLIMVESDKASMEIPSPHAGIVKELKVALGDKVSEGSLLLTLDVSDENASEEKGKAASASPAAAEDMPVPVPAVPAEPVFASQKPASKQEQGQPIISGQFPHASPSVRKFARELGINLNQIRGTGPKNRILREDVQAYVKSAMSEGTSSQGSSGNDYFHFPAWPSLDFSELGPTELRPLSRIKKISGPNLHRNLVMIPHVTQHEDADVTELDAFRLSQNKLLATEGIRLTMLSFVIKACVTVLKKYPQFNASMDADGQNLILKHYYHIAFAADTPQGLVVPVVKNADKKGLLEIAKEVADLAAQAREGKINPSDLQGASFTITSLGGIGGTYFTPFINAPQVSIIGLSRMSMKPVWNGSEFVPRMILPLSLAYDHRVIDGAEGARFVSYLAEVLDDMKKTLL